MSAGILTVTVNPALDVTTEVPKLLPQRKLRCSRPRYDPGGGGVNVSRAIKALGGESTAFVALGGGSGAHHRLLLEAAGIAADVWPAAGETRLSMTVMEKEVGLHYRFILPGPEQPVHATDTILAALSQRLAAHFRYVVASGSLPPGIDADFYGRLASLARANDGFLILDTHGEALKAAIPHRPYIIRLNHFEAQELVGGDANQAAHALVAELVAQHAAEIVIVTIGDDGAIVGSAGGQFEIRPPKVAVRSMVGAGDSFVAALTLALSRGWSLQEASRFGVAAAAAAVTTEATQLCDAETVEGLYRDMAQTPVLAVAP